MLNRDQLVSVVYDAFFATAEEHDQSWLSELPMLWAAVEPVLLDSDTGTRFHAKVLGFDGEQEATAATIALLAMASAVLETTNQGRSRTTPEEIEHAFRAAARAVKLAKANEDRLADTFAKHAFRVLSNLRGEGEGSATTEERLFVDRMVSDRKHATQAYSSRFAKSLPKRRSYDIVVSEHEERVVIEGADCLILNHSLQRRGMLWLVLQNVGRSISHRMIQDRFGIDAYRQVYQYIRHFEEIVGRRLRSRILEESKNQHYHVKNTGWSYCWLRHIQDPQESLLLKSHTME